MKDDKLIAEFIGVVPDNKGWYDGYELYKAGFPFAYGAMGNGTNELKLQKSWDWLMPVVEKIINKTSLAFHPKQYLEHAEDKAKEQIFEAMSTIDIDNVYKAVVEFIKWYNKQKLS